MLSKAELAASSSDLNAVVKENAEHFFQAQGLGFAIHQSYGVDRERIFKRRSCVELLENSFWIKTVLDFNNETEAMNTIGEVLNSRNAFETPCRDILFDLFDDLFGTNHVRELSDNEAHLSRSNAFNLNLGTSLKGTSPGFVGFLHALEPNDDTAFGKVRPGDVSHEVTN